MIVFDLRCGTGHVFEAWFGSSTAYEEQREAGFVLCPICGDATVEKAVMAPRVAAKGNQRDPSASRPVHPQGHDAPAPAAVKAAMQALAAAQAKALEGSQWVGTAFAERARSMHLGEEKEIPIHGRASVEEARSLIEEGVPVAPLPLPFVPPEASN